MLSTTSLPSLGTPDLHALSGGDLSSVLAWLGTGVGFGLLSGWAVGYALKKVALFAAFIVGVVFIIIQLMVVNRLVTVDWNAVATFFGQASRVVSGPHASWWNVLLSNFPYAGSFGVGFFLGFRKG